MKKAKVGRPKGSKNKVNVEAPINEPTKSEGFPARFVVAFINFMGEIHIQSYDSLDEAEEMALIYSEGTDNRVIMGWTHEG